MEEREQEQFRRGKEDGNGGRKIMKNIGESLDRPEAQILKNPTLKISFPKEYILSPEMGKVTILDTLLIDL